MYAIFVMPAKNKIIYDAESINITGKKSKISDLCI